MELRDDGNGGGRINGTARPKKAGFSKPVGVEVASVLVALAIIAIGAIAAGDWIFAAGLPRALARVGRVGLGDLVSLPYVH